MTTEFVYRKIVCPHAYFPDRPDRSCYRITMSDGDKLIGFVDYFIEDGWWLSPVFSVHPDYRSESTIMTFIERIYQMIGDIEYSFWWETPSFVERYFDGISDLRPEIMFVASGDIRKINNPKPYVIPSSR